MTWANFLALIVDDSHLNSRQRNLRTSWLSCGDAWQWRDHDGAGFGLPPGVHNWSLVAADDLAVPHPGLRVDWLTNAAKHTNRAQVVVSCDLSSDLHEAANCGWSGVEDIHVVLLNDVPPSAPVWAIWSSLVDHLSRAISKWAIGNV